MDFFVKFEEVQLVQTSGGSGGSGSDGKSAYELAVEEGFTGTLDEWLASLKGEKGDTGATGPQGEKGDTGATGPQGEPGEAATIQIGSVTTGEAGSSAEVTNSGTSSAAVFDFTIPKGDKGEIGATGEAGYTPVRGTDYWTDEDIATIKAYVDEAILGGSW